MSADPLARFLAEFDLPRGVTYLDGHSLGPPPRAALARVREAAERQWAYGLVRSWNDADWIGAPERVGAKIASLIGAKPHEVLVADSTTVNLWKLAAAAMQARPERRVVLSEPGNFPTDLYALEGVVKALGGERRLELAPVANIGERLTEEAALFVLTHVHYKTAEVRDMAALTAAAHTVGALALWDLSHSIGAVEVDLNGAGVDLAVGCGYKYLNGGPGAPAFLFVAERLQAALSSPLSGWMGHAAPFAFEDAYRPVDGVLRFACGTPPILSLSALEASVDLAVEAGAPALAGKARALGDAFIAAVDAGPAGRALRLISPREAGRRGGHVAYAHGCGYEIMAALIARGVIGDFREPDVLRFGFSPLYLGFEDAERAAAVLHEIVETQAWRDPAHAVRSRVT